MWQLVILIDLDLWADQVSSVGILVYLCVLVNAVVLIEILESPSNS